ncbi:MAG: hypothetical protein IPK19_09525 [Chloroflexi bacterium]|nr:hypothetical protein [Chloroflexota bacterium]
MTDISPADSQFDPLTNRELDILKLLAQGLSNQEIAASLVVEVLSLIAHHPGTMESTRAQAEPVEARLRSSLSADDFALAWKRGQHIELGDLLTELMER